MGEISIKAEPIFHIGSFAVTNSYFLSVIVVLILVSVGWFLRRHLSVIPGKLQSIFELLFEEILKLMDTILGSRSLSEQYFPLIATIFLFVMLSNWLGLLPGTGSLGLRHIIFEN